MIGYVITSDYNRNSLWLRRDTCAWWEGTWLIWQWRLVWLTAVHCGKSIHHADLDILLPIYCCGVNERHISDVVPYINQSINQVVLYYKPPAYLTRSTSACGCIAYCFSSENPISSIHAREIASDGLRSHWDQMTSCRPPLSVTIKTALNSVCRRKEANEPCVGYITTRWSGVIYVMFTSCRSQRCVPSAIFLRLGRNRPESNQIPARIWRRQSFYCATLAVKFSPWNSERVLLDKAKHWLTEAGRHSSK